MTLREIAQKYVRRFTAARDPFSIADEIVADMKTWTISDRPLTAEQLERLLGFIREELNASGGMPAIVHDGSNAGSITLVALLAAKLGVKGK